MPTVSARPPRPGFPASPCNEVCTLNDYKVCIGCKRTLHEIVEWSSMTAKQQWQVVRSLSDRLP